ncbi:electron transfer flavoprotein subunit beta, partial [Halomonas heilongjiangensis]
VTTPAELGVEVASKVTLLKVAPPPERQGGIKVGSVDELVDKLKNEANVL